MNVKFLVNADSYFEVEAGQSFSCALSSLAKEAVSTYSDDEGTLKIHELMEDGSNSTKTVKVGGDSGT